MTNNQLTKERLAQIYAEYSKPNHSKAFNVPDSELAEIARMALAAMDSEPVAWEWLYYKQWNVTNDPERARDVAEGGVEVFPLHRHAQQSVVPAEWTIADAVKFCKETGRQDAGAAMDAWNACRAAMLNGGNS